MRGFRLGSILGLEIRIDYSWFIIFLLVLWTLTAGLFPGEYPGLAPRTYLLMGLAGTVAFFASLLAHELAHSVVARRRGIEMEGITLFVFGGMARTRGEAETPRDELLIAAVGPIASLALAAGFLGIERLGAALGWADAVIGVAAYLAYINLALAVFNLLPGFPLDGGRVFRAVAWRVTGDQTRATRWAARGGTFLGYFLIGTGLLLMFLAGGLISGLWLVFIGWFIRTAADASLSHHLLSGFLAGVRVREVMTADPVTVGPDLPVEEFVDRYLLRGRHQAYPVVRDDHVRGLVSLAAVTAVPREQWSSLRVSDIMRPVGPDAIVDLNDAMMPSLERLASAPDGRLLVLRDGELAGILTRADLTRWLERARLLGLPGAPSGGPAGPAASKPG